MIFNNVNLLAYNHESKFLGGDAVFIGIIKTVEINGYVLDLANTLGVKNILNNVNLMRQSLQQFQDIIINNKNFGRGKAVSFSVDPGNWVKTTEYQATFEILEQVNIQGISSSEFSSLNLSNKNLHLIKNFTEDFSIDFDRNNKVLGGSHTIEIQYDAKDANADLLSQASFLASELLKTLPSALDEGNYTLRPSAVQINSETYNLIDGKCGFSKTFSYNNEDVSKQYSISRNNIISLDENGIANVSEDCEIKVENQGDYESILTDAIKNEVENSYSRCLSLFNKYKNDFKISGLAPSLISRAIQVTKRIDKFNRTGSFNISFNNDEKRINADVTYERSLTLSRTEEYIWTASESGTITGRGKIGSPEKFQFAQNKWSSIKGSVFDPDSIASRIINFYTYIVTNSFRTPIQVRANVSKNKYLGTITYNYEFSDDPSLTPGSDKIVINRSDTGLVPLTKDFVVVNNKYVLKQERGYQQQGTHTVNVTLDVGCSDFNSNQVFNGRTYFNQIKSLAGFDRSEFGGGNVFDSYLESISFTSDEIEKRLTYQEVYKYS